MKRGFYRHICAVLAAVLLVPIVECHAGTDVIEPILTRVSVSSSGEQAEMSETFLGYSGSEMPSISADGRYVVFAASPVNLVTDDTNEKADVFVRDLVAGTTERVSLNSDEQQAAGGDSLAGVSSISGDGRYTAFSSEATNLVSGDTNGKSDVFIRDRVSGTTERISVNSAEQQSIGGYSGSEAPSISADGRYVAFSSNAENIVTGAGGFACGGMCGKDDIFVRDRVGGTTEIVSVDSSEVISNSPFNSNPSISGDGRYVAFSSYATNLVANDTNNQADVFVRDRVSGTTEIVSVDSSGALGNSYSSSPSISYDGRYVAFSSGAANLVADDTNGISDVFVRDRVSGTTERVNVNSNGQQATGGWGTYSPALSPNGRYVTFSSDAANLVAGDSNDLSDVFIHDRTSRQTVCITCAGTAGSFSFMGFAATTSGLTDSGYIALCSSQESLVANDTNYLPDIFVSTPVFVDTASNKSPLFLLMNNVLGQDRTGLQKK